MTNSSNKLTLFSFLHRPSDLAVDIPTMSPSKNNAQVVLKFKDKRAQYKTSNELICLLKPSLLGTDDLYPCRISEHHTVNSGVNTADAS